MGFHLLILPHSIVHLSELSRVICSKSSPQSISSPSVDHPVTNPLGSKTSSPSDQDPGRRRRLPIPSGCAHSGLQESFTEVIISPLGILEKNSTPLPTGLSLSPWAAQGSEVWQCGHSQALACLPIQDGTDHRKLQKAHRPDVMRLPTSAITRQASAQAAGGDRAGLT